MTATTSVLSFGTYPVRNYPWRSFLTEPFYEAIRKPAMGKCYRRFAKMVGDLTFGGDGYFLQRVPTFRVSPPGHCEPFHTDDEKGHQPGTVVCWVPLTDAYGTNALWLGEPMAMSYGQYLVFDPIARVHGQPVNLTDHTRVSFDFRMIRRADYRPTEARSVNTGQLLAPGDYFI